jgi:hypothetical protein
MFSLSRKAEKRKHQLERFCLVLSERLLESCAAFRQLSCFCHVLCSMKGDRLQEMIQLSPHPLFHRATRAIHEALFNEKYLMGQRRLQFQYGSRQPPRSARCTYGVRL